MRRLVCALLLCFSTSTVTHEAPLVTAYGRSHDVVAQCLVWQMPPHFRAWPGVPPPPSEEAVVNIHVRGHDQAEDPIGGRTIRAGRAHVFRKGTRTLSRASAGLRRSIPAALAINRRTIELSGAIPVKRRFDANQGKPHCETLDMRLSAAIVDELR